MTKENEVMNKVNEEINKDEILNELQKEYDVFDMLDYNEYTVNDKLRNNPYYTEQFRLLYMTEKSKLERLKRILDERKAELYDYYRTKSSLDLKKTEIERYYLLIDEKVKEYTKLIEKQQTRVNFFEAVYEAFKTQGWMMKQYLQNLREGI